MNIQNRNDISSKNLFVQLFLQLGGTVYDTLYDTIQEPMRLGEL